MQRPQCEWTGTGMSLPAVDEYEVTWPSYKGASAYLAKLRAEARGEAAS